MNYKILSWNVNGIRAAERKGILDFLDKVSPDILAIQETKANLDQLTERLINPKGYTSYWHSAEKKGYSGTSVYSKETPLKESRGLANDYFNHEGRVLSLEYEKFIIYNIYFPNGGSGVERLKFKLDFYREFLSFVKKYLKKKKRKTLLVCGDFNTAHCEIDLARPKENAKSSGFMKEERILLDELIKLGMVDSFRVFDKEPGNYSWWDYKTRARERNIGWRIDYFFIDKESLSYLKDAFIMDDIFGSDHCPVGINLKF